MEKLKEYTVPIRDRINSLEIQMAKTKQEENRFNSAIMPNQAEIKEFTKEAIKTLHNLNYEVKRAIMMSVLDKVIGTQQKLEVYGYLPITPNVKFQTISRNSGSA